MAVAIPCHHCGARLVGGVDARARREGLDLFISYAEPDRGWAEGFLADGLRDRGVRCLTQAGFRLGAFFTAEFERVVRESQRVVLVLSGAYLADVTQRFVENLAQCHALKDEAASIIPLLYEDVPPPDWADARVCLRATTEAERSEAVERLAVECKAGPPGAAAEPECPYPGILPFSRANADYFCGRKKLAGELLQELRHRPCLFLIGPSRSCRRLNRPAGRVNRQLTAAFLPGHRAHLPD
jgi:hypothetical protein